MSHNTKAALLNIRKQKNEESSVKKGGWSVTGMLTSPVNDNETTKIDN